MFASLMVMLQCLPQITAVDLSGSSHSVLRHKRQHYAQTETMVTPKYDVRTFMVLLTLQIPICWSYSSTRFFFQTTDSSSNGWPSGTYTLLQPASGCPMTGSWSAGSIHQDTEDTLGGNHFSKDVSKYLQGTFMENNIITHYCTKTYSSGSSDWPNGSYCIMRHGWSCPSGFNEGYISWDDEDDNNGNRAYGTLPDEVYETYYWYPHGQSNIKIHYCCRDDGDPHQAISLPTSYPFVLVRNGLTCQQVAGMSLHEVYIHWDDEDINNQDSAGGAHPYDDGGDTDHTLYFCHYQSVTTAGGGPLVG